MMTRIWLMAQPTQVVVFLAGVALFATPAPSQRFVPARAQMNLIASLPAFPTLDVDGNGAPEFFSTEFVYPDSSDLLIVRNDGSGLLGPVSRFRAHTSTLGWIMERPLLLADIDRDGMVDVVSHTVGSLFIHPARPCPCPLMVFMGLGNGRFAGEPFGRFGGLRLPGTSYAGAADLNGDGAVDFLFYDSGAKVFLNDGTGHFAELPNAFPVGATGAALRLVDLDGDRYVDYVATNATTTGAGVFLNDRTGRFPQQVWLTTPGLLLETADFDLDGDQDIAFLFPNLNALPRLEIWINDGRAAFTNEPLRLPGVDWTDVIGYPGHPFVVEDLDCDGDHDFILSRGSRPSLFLLNDGHGFFSDGTTALGAQNVVGDLAVDLDRDGDPDLLDFRQSNPAIWYVNTTRQIIAADPVVGGSLDLDLYSDPGNTVGFVLGYVRRDFAVPGIGWLAIDPASSAVYPGVFTVPPGRKVRVSMPVPNVSHLRGLQLQAQLFEFDRAARPRLGNVWAVTIQ
ncbi:MAG: VCBS repeat-containing protein [Planctomycetes bacterium]|nr:VCBS repeat-containing protein [Planctomycetota bacterium]